MKQKILIVDDDSTIRSLVNITLVGAGYDVVEADDAFTALSYLKKTKFNLIIMDVNMPNMDGITCSAKIKNEADYVENKDVPIVMLTVEGDDEMKARGKQAGAKAWIIKPFMPDILISVVQKMLK
ncbi:MAG: response regulator [Spirochaetia bacterium]|nr:response regulator [Spirochaetia bacterium]